jgi:ssDNA-binding Zn-finger/Zn-ribbon topoisomerase 1
MKDHLESLNKSVEEAFDKIEKKAVKNIKANDTTVQNYSGIKCPKCGSSGVIINKKGFSIGQAITGGILLFPVGALFGFVGSNKVIVKCPDCHFTWKFDNKEKNHG